MRVSEPSAEKLGRLATTSRRVLGAFRPCQHRPRLYASSRLDSPGQASTKPLGVCVKNTILWKNEKAPSMFGNFVLYGGDLHP